MEDPKLLFFVTDVFEIAGRGTVVSGELLEDINLGEDIFIFSQGKILYNTSILGIDKYIGDRMEKTKKAYSEDVVGVWIDIPKEKIEKGMAVFLDIVESVEPSPEELISSIDTITENAVERDKSLIDEQLEKYLIPLQRKNNELIYIDDYGDYCFDLWWDECAKFIDNKLFPIKFSLVKECREIIRNMFSQLGSYEVCDEYIETRVIDLIKYHIDDRLTEFEGDLN